MEQLAKTIRHLVRALKQTKDESKQRDLAKVICIDADSLAEKVLQFFEAERHSKKKKVSIIKRFLPCEYCNNKRVVMTSHLDDPEGYGGLRPCPKCNNNSWQT